MSDLYGTVQGSKGTASRTGSKVMETYAASWDGAVRVFLHKTDEGTTFRVEQTSWQGEGIGEELAFGVVGKPTDFTPHLVRHIKRQLAACDSAHTRAATLRQLHALVDEAAGLH